MKDRLRRIEVRVVKSGVETTGFEAITYDEYKEKPESTQRWIVVVRAVVVEGGVYVCVENRVEADDPTAPVRIGRPRVVAELLGLPSQRALGSSTPLRGAQEISEDQIKWFVESLLRSSGRRLPAIVCTEPRRDDHGNWRKRAEKIHRRVEGFANVFTMEVEAWEGLKRYLGECLAVWDGAVRVYAPSSLAGCADSFRHRYFREEQIERSWEHGVDRVVSTAARMSSKQRLPREFSIFAAPVAARTDLVRIESLEEEKLELQIALEEIESELNRANGHLDRLREACDRSGMSDIFWGAKDEVADGPPDNVDDIEDAVLNAQVYLSDWVALPGGALRDVELLSNQPQSEVWGNTCWRGFRALASYARAKSRGCEGGFWEWCQSGPAQGWPATDKKLSMNESEAVRNNPKLWEHRLLPVDSGVDPSGRIYMVAHLKIQEGGGDLAPRVYFYDDTQGRTKKVHVGFVGPHRYMPNTKTS
ncbi:hypothetical protein J5X07_11260 [Actinomyces bowdenii]|uniref:Uncharacterized protein n=1 Tax=Actinomyces bowdenii TaxID=131109 RepID=A0A3P1VB04_9ACTO|nr:hypothetical protein [Actinomyces bowdenii]MBO3725594.1 hypothetical protein [Actinomyces bowdenii]RRD30585.1 hypothetical protein EII10_00180 [Actinomyces bowdenii]